MGLAFSSSPDAGYDKLDEGLDALLKSLSMSDNRLRSCLRSLSFNGRDSEPILKRWGSGKLLLKGSLSFNRRDKEAYNVDGKSSPRSPLKLLKSTRFARVAPLPESFVTGEPGSPKHEAAAVKLQKVYKSFRTRRQLADCAVLVEQRWWKLLDFAMLKRSSVTFFDIAKNESAVSKWSRAKSRAAKVGKGLSKDEKARKLALQHWLEAIDPRHRYGHNLQYYYDCWLRCQSRQPFFYWLDVGEGKEVSLDEKCPRSDLQHQCIKYLGPKEREVYEVIVEDGKLMYKKTGELLDTTGDSSDSKWIFVLSTSRNLYVGQKKKGTFQHSSFLAGGATSAAGRLEVQNGILKAIWPHSGHYRPTEENFQEFVAYLELKNVDLTNVQKSPVEGEEDSCYLRPSRSAQDLTGIISTEEAEPETLDGAGGMRVKPRKRSKSFDESTDSARGKSEEEEKARNKQIVDDDDDSEVSEEEEEAEGKTDNDSHLSNSKQGVNRRMEAVSPSKKDYRFLKENLFAEEKDSEEPKVSSDLILRRMKFRKRNLSLQLGKQLSCRWTTGAGPRIGCVRDYPSELRLLALEQVHLSPRGGRECKGWPSPGNLPSPIPRASSGSKLLNFPSNGGGECRTWSSSPGNSPGAIARTSSVSKLHKERDFSPLRESSFMQDIGRQKNAR